MATFQQCQNKGYYFVEAAVLAFWAVANVVLYKRLKAVHRGFFCDDESIRYPHLPETVSGNILLAFTFIVPILIILGLELFLRVRNSKMCKGPGSTSGGGGGGVCAGWVWVLGVYFSYFFGFAVMNLTVTVLKLTTGQLRPHFVAVCKPDVPLSQPACSIGQYISEYNCTSVGMAKEIEFARHSFPSGHAANTFLTAAFMILYVERRVRIQHLHFLKLSLYAVLTLYALWVSTTRLTDNVHHLMDVVVGAGLGIVCAVASFYVAADRYCKKDNRGFDVESGNRDTEEENSNNNNNNNNNNRSDEDDDVDNGILDLLETEGPSTPTPLLFNGGPLSSNTGLRFGLLRLEGDKYKFPRRATLQ